MNKVRQTQGSCRRWRQADRECRLRAAGRHASFETFEPRNLLHADPLLVGIHAENGFGEDKTGDAVEMNVLGNIGEIRFVLDVGEFGEKIFNTGDPGQSINLGEPAAASIAGVVHLDDDGDSRRGSETPLAGVTLRLLDAKDHLIATTRTDTHGWYLFDQLAPGVYSITQDQPLALFDGGQVAPSGNGDASGPNQIRGIRVLGESLSGYDFLELPPATLSGFVFQDGESVITSDGQPPTGPSPVRDGRLTDDDTRLPGVSLELRNGVNGEPITADAALPGTYPDGPIHTTTDANGFYRFDGLPAGNFAIYEIQPAGFADGIDTPGTTTGIAVNRVDAVDLLLLDLLSEDPQDDAIIRIPLRHGEHSQLNNFSEIVVGRETIVFPLHPSARQPAPTLPPSVPVRSAVNRSVVSSTPGTLIVPELNGSGRAVGHAWHLSVVNAGRPRGDEHVEHGDSTVWMTSTITEPPTWDNQYARKARWRLARVDNGQVTEIRYDVFGLFGGIPVTGDFNGDGTDDYGVFCHGEWLIDLNGDHAWDRNDLWAKLGTHGDLPVTGDWDGDGKDDIGIFGPVWPGDRRALAAEPGLPDMDNRVADRFKNLPPRPAEATIGHRLLKLTEQGRTRADLIDHVFHYGTAGDQPVTGDWNGDGIRTIGIFRDGKWRLDVDGDGKLSSRDEVANFGKSNDLPVVGDFNGDGIDEIGVYREGIWILDTNGNLKQDAYDEVFRLGGIGELPMVGDWNGDGKDDVGVYGEVIANVATS